MVPANAARVGRVNAALMSVTTSACGLAMIVIADAAAAKNRPASQDADNSAKDATHSAATRPDAAALTIA